METPILQKINSWQMFDEIAPRYDFLNHLLSFGLDIHWRRELRRFLLPRQDQKILDLATGTAEVLIELCQNNFDIESACGIDLAQKMLDLGREKISQKGLTNIITLQHGDAKQIPFEENTFDHVSIAFGIRNVDDPSQVLNEMQRVLNPGGRALILEFSLPQNKLIRFVHLFYLRTIVPILGAIFSGHYQAYRYLNQTIETFPYGQPFCALMTKAKFQNVKANALLFGVATIYQGEK